MTAGGGRRSRSRSPAVCGCCGDPEARRRRRRTQGRRTVSCGCPAADAADDGGGSSHRYWSGSPPRTPPDWRDSFQQLRRRWSDEARRRSTRRGSQDRQRPSNPSPGEIRALAGSNRPGAQPEYAASGPDPAPWTPEAQAASAPTLQQRLAELQRWQDATLRVSVEAIEPTSGSHFSLAACWDPDSTPNTHITSTSTPPHRASAIGPAPVVEPTVSSSSASSQSDEDSVTEESDSEEDHLEQVWEEVDEVLHENPIDKDETRAEVESILRASVLSQGEKLAVINAALEESAKSPEERRETAKSMLRRSTPGVREVSDTDDPEREASFSHVRRSSAGRRSSRGSRVRSLVEEFEAEGTKERRVTDSRRGSRKSTMTREHRKSTRVEEDAGGRTSKGGNSVHWKSIALAPVDSRKSSIRASVTGPRQSQDARKSELHEELGSVFGKSNNAGTKSVYYEAHPSQRPSQRRSTRRSSPWRAGSSIAREKLRSATGDAFNEARSSTRMTENWSMDASHGSHASTYDSGESEVDERTSHRQSSGRRSTPRSSRVPRESHFRRSTAASSVHHEDDELLPTRSLRKRKPTGWPRHSSNADAEADEWATPRRTAEDSFHSAIDDTSRHSHRGSSRRTTHEPPEARVSDIEEYSSEEETKRLSSRPSILEEGDPAERQRWSSRRRDDEDDEGGAAAGGSVLSRRSSGRKSSGRRSTYFDAEQSPHPRKKSSRSGTDERNAHCCCVAGDHESCPALTSSNGSKQCISPRSDRLASASDICCCRSKAARQTAGMGDVSSGSSECCCHSWGALSPAASDVSWDECSCSCYCNSVCGSAPELTYVRQDDDVGERDTSRETPVRKGDTSRETPVRKGDTSRETPVRKGDTSRETPIRKGDTSRETPVRKGDTSRETPIRKGDTSRETPIRKGDTSRETPIRKGDTSTETPVRKGDTSRETPVRKGDTSRETPVRKGALKKRDLEVDVPSESLREEETAKRGAISQEVHPAVKASKSAEPALIWDRPLPQKKKRKQQIVEKGVHAVQHRHGCWRRRLLRYAPCLVAGMLWLLCVWWFCGMLRPLFLPDHCRSRRCDFWAP